MYAVQMEPMRDASRCTNEAGLGYTVVLAML